LTAINQALLIFKENNRISQILVDTYERELERYGANIMEETEQWFGADSDMVLGFINATSKENRDDLRWIFACKALDILLNDFDCTTQAKLSLMESMRDSFAREFNLDKPMKLLLDAKFRKTVKYSNNFWFWD
jgi:thiopeptide-type bacteriocin biosynthesis protein